MHIPSARRPSAKRPSAKRAGARTGLVAAILLALAGTAVHAPPAVARVPRDASVHRLSGLRVIPLAVTHAGKRHRFRVELAATPEQQSQGLMFRKAMGADEGMIFPMQPSRYASFWMKNTVLPLDIVFIGEDRRILSVARGRPYDERPIMSGGPVVAVLELNAGRAAALGLAPGDAVAW